MDYLSQSLITLGPFPASIASDQPLGFSSLRYRFRGLFPPELTQRARLTLRPDARSPATALYICATRVLCLRDLTLLCFPASLLSPLQRRRNFLWVAESHLEPGHWPSLLTLFYHGARPLAFHAPALSVSFVYRIVALSYRLFSLLPYYPFIVSLSATGLSRSASFVFPFSLLVCRCVELAFHFSLAFVFVLCFL